MNSRPIIRLRHGAIFNDQIEMHLAHLTQILDQTLQTTLNVANASLITQHGLKPAERAE